MVPTDVENLTFISYAREDADFAMALASDLRKAGVNIWLDRFDIPVGHNWPRAVQQALDSSGRFIIILSPVSVESQNVSAELDFALDEGKEVFPVLYKACRRPFRIRALQYADFDTAYESGLIELVKGLGIQPRRTDSALQNQPASAELSAKVSEENNSSKALRMLRIRNWFIAKCLGPFRTCSKFRRSMTYRSNRALASSGPWSPLLGRKSLRRTTTLKIVRIRNWFTAKCLSPSRICPRFRRLMIYRSNPKLASFDLRSPLLGSRFCSPGRCSLAGKSGWFLS